MCTPLKRKGTCYISPKVFGDSCFQGENFCLKKLSNKYDLGNLWLLTLSPFRNKMSEASIKGKTRCYSLIKPWGVPWYSWIGEWEESLLKPLFQLSAHFNEMPVFSCQILKETSGYQLMKRFHSLMASKLK